MTPQSDVGSDSGFTLIELIVATAITGIITASLTAMLSGFLLNAEATRARMSQSHDVQSAASYFAQDVNALGVRDWTDDTRPSRQSVETGVAFNTGLYPCGVAGTPNALVRMAWNDFDPASPTPAKLFVVAYVVKPAGLGGSRQLHRLVCQGSSLQSDRVLVASLSTGESVTCTPAPCTTNPAPLKVTMTVAVHDPKNKNPDYTLELTGHRRQT